MNFQISISAIFLIYHQSETMAVLCATVYIILENSFVGSTLSTRTVFFNVIIYPVSITKVY